jgi:hypothetical protein
MIEIWLLFPVGPHSLGLFYLLSLQEQMTFSINVDLASICAAIDCQWAADRYAAFLPYEHQRWECDPALSGCRRAVTVEIGIFNICVSTIFAGGPLASDRLRFLC